MSTRATYQFKDEREDFTVYKHHDGYPSGGLQWIALALPHAWQLPRFEASDFAAAFVAGNKPSFETAIANAEREGWGSKPSRQYHGGGVYLTKDRDSHCDTEYHYVVTGKGDQLCVEIFEPQRNYKTNACHWKMLDSGTLVELMARHAK